MNHDTKHSPWRVVEYHGSLNGRVLWMDELRIEMPWGGKTYRNVTTLPALTHITVSVTL